MRSKKDEVPGVISTILKAILSNSPAFGIAGSSSLIIRSIMPKAIVLLGLFFPLLNFTAEIALEKQKSRKGHQITSFFERHRGIFV